MVSTKDRELLQNIYFKFGGPASFSGVDSLLREAKKTQPHITRGIVEKYLKSTYTYNIHKKPHKVKQYIPTVVTNKNLIFECDLSFHAGTQLKSLLHCVDKFSNQHMATALTSKTPTATFRAFERLITQQNEGIYPAAIHTDAGKEFVGSEFRGQLQKRSIKHKVLTGPHKAASVEHGQFMCVFFSYFKCIFF